MRLQAVHQLLSGFADGDAISHCALALQRAFHACGMASGIFAAAEHTSPSMRRSCQPLEAYHSAPGDAVLYHHAIASRAQEAFLRADARRILLYHNVTPAEYFDGFDDRVAAQLRAARAAVPGVALAADACWAVSAFNAAELGAAGIAETRVLPLPFSSEHLDAPPDAQVLEKFATKLTTWLYVGRVAPNKRIETLIEAFYWYHKTLNPLSRLVIVGSEHTCPRYFAMLRMLAGDFDLANVCFEGFASPGGLPTYYRLADVFVTASEHEGYCLPLLEAMHLGLPVVARAIGGMPEAMGGAGVLYDDLAPAELAVLVHRILTDAGLRDEILAAQRRRIEEVRRRDLTRELRELLAGLVPVAAATGNPAAWQASRGEV